MTIFEAITIIEKFLETYGEKYPGPGSWAPVETKLVPSGDEQNTIKLWLNLGSELSEADLPKAREQLLGDLTAAHPELAAFTLALRVEGF